MKRIGVFGASFNPPTLGHRDVVNQALDHFDEILLVPSLFHAFRKSLAPIEHRLAMLKIFSKNWQANENNCIVSIFNIEAKMHDEAPNLRVIYTYDVLAALEKYYATLNTPVSLRFIIGPDIAAKEVWQKFYRYQDIEKKWSPFIAKEKILARSTMVKDAVAKYVRHMEYRPQMIAGAGCLRHDGINGDETGETNNPENSIAKREKENLVKLVGEGIAQYIVKNQLYFPALREQAYG